MRFRRVSLRMIFVLLAVFALLLGWWANEARRQRQLVSDTYKINGICKRRPRDWIPDQLHSFLGEDYCSYVVEVSVGGMIAPSSIGIGLDGRAVEAVDPDKLDQLFSLRAMEYVEALEVYGTAVSDDLILANVSNLPNLQSLRFHMTAVTEKGAAKVSEILPSCEVTWGTASNGSEIIRWHHRDQLHLTEDLELLRRVEDGEPEAVRELLHIAVGHQPRYATVALDSLGKATGPKALAVFREGLADDDPLVRRVAVEALGRLRNFNTMYVALGDADAQVRALCLRYLVNIDHQRSFDALIKATRDQNPQVRWLAVHKLIGFDDSQTLDALIQAVMHDEDDTVRAAAARVLGGISEPRSIEALKRATNDDSSIVQSHATSSLRHLESLDVTP